MVALAFLLAVQVAQAAQAAQGAQGAQGAAAAGTTASPTPHAPLPEVVTRSRVDASRGVDFHALVVPETVYVGQQATYQLGVFLDQDTRQRIRRNPEFQPPETRSLLSYDLREPAGSVAATLGGRLYEVHVFRRALFPLTQGRYPIPQARLSYALPQTSSFFSREENFTLRSEDVAFVAVEPPAAGRPGDWAGAVGSWRAVARVDTTRGRAGEPFVLTLRVEGQGNVTLLPRPRVTIPWATVVNADERVRLDSTPALLAGWKEFDWLVTPGAPGVQRVPTLRFSYFNPRTRRYEVATSEPLDVRVVAGDVIAATPRNPPPPPPFALPIRPTLGHESAPPLGTSPAVLILIAVAPLAAFVLWMTRRPRRPKPAPTPRQRLAAVGDRNDADAVRDVRRALFDGLRLRTGLEPAHLTDRGGWTLALRKAGVSAEAAAAVEALVTALDAACFSQTPPVWERGTGWAAQAREALAIVDAEACAPGRGVRGAHDTNNSRGARGPGASRGAAATASLVLLAVGMSVPVRAQVLASDAFALGSTAYAGGDFLRAERHFADAAQAAPGSAAAWANLGTSAFLAHDTASAVLGWQRALRLEPMNGELRALLDRIRAPQESGYAVVPPVPGAVAVVAALLIWLTGWGLTARQCWRKRPAWRVAVVTMIVGGAALAAAWDVERRLAGVNLVVVAEPAPLRALPTLGAESGATPMVGEVAEVVERRGVWAHIHLDGGRDGWMPAERIASLGRD